MGKIIFSYFKSYTGRLAKLQFEESASRYLYLSLHLCFICNFREDLLGAEETQAKGFFFKPSLKNKTTVFSVGTRGEVLAQELEAPIIVPHAQQKSEQKYPFEMLFRSIQVSSCAPTATSVSTHFVLFLLSIVSQYAMVDNACREFLFISEFFILDSTSAQEIFNNIFNKTVSLLVKHSETYISDSFDSIAIFLCIHLVQR